MLHSCLDAQYRLLDNPIVHCYNIVAHLCKGALSIMRKKLVQSLQFFFVLLLIMTFTSCNKCNHESLYTNITPPTCISQGYTTYSCKNCEYSYTDDYTVATEHTIAVDPRVEPSFTATGLTEGYHCSTCQKVFVAQSIIPELPATSMLFATTLTSRNNEFYNVLPSEIADFDFSTEFTTSNNSPWTVSTDKNGFNIIASKTAPLVLGDNIFYIHVTNPNQTVDTYLVILYRGHFLPSFDISNYFDVTELVLYEHQGNLKNILVDFSYIPLSNRINSPFSSVPFVSTHSPMLNVYTADNLLYSLLQLTPIRIVEQYNPANSLSVIEKEFQNQFGLSFSLSLMHNKIRSNDQVETPLETYDYTILISSLTEEGTYYLLNTTNGIIVECCATALPFLRYAPFDWVCQDVFQGHIAYMEKMEILTPAGLGGTTSFVFELDNTASLDPDNPNTHIMLPTDKLLVYMGDKQIDAHQFKLFYARLICLQLKGFASCSEEEQALFLAAANSKETDYALNNATPVLAIDITFNSALDGSGENILLSCAFYTYHTTTGTGHCFVAINGNGNCYVNLSSINEIIATIPSTEL